MPDPAKGEALPDRRERAALALADRISVAMVRREDEPADVCRWHRDVVDRVLDAVDFGRLRADVVTLKEEQVAFVRALEQAQTERDGFDEQCRGFAQAARETGTEMDRLRAEVERLTHDRDAFERTAALQAEEADRAKAENERLRAALTEIGTRATFERNPDGFDQAAFTMQLIANDALASAGASDEDGAS